MRININNKIKLSFIFTFLSNFIFAGAWLQQPGNTEVYFQTFAYQSCNYWNGNGNLSQSACYNSLAFNPQAEVGINNMLSLGGGVFAQSATQSDNSYYGTNANLYAKMRIWHNDNSVLSAQVTQFVPTGNNFGGDPMNQSINVYQQNLNTEGRLLYGIGGNRWYLDLEGGIGQSFNNYGQTIVTQSAFGLKGEEQKWITELKLLTTYNINDPELAGITPPYNYYNIYTVSPSFTYNINKYLGWSVSMYQDLYGQNVGQGTSLAAALIWRP